MLFGSAKMLASLTSCRKPPSPQNRLLQGYVTLQEGELPASVDWHSTASTQRKTPKRATNTPITAAIVAAELSKATPIQLVKTSSTI